MFALQLLTWWYGRGFGWVIESTFKRANDIRESFSISILLKTWFSPWKQITTPSSFRNFFQAAIDNIISRFVGATVRTGLLLGSFFAIILALLVGLVVILLWPFLPLMIFILPILFVSG
jgi:hypothetical protein